MLALAAVVRLVRPINLLITMAGVVVGAVLAHGRAPLPEAYVLPLALACGSAACVAAGANVYNDLVDRDIDAVNRKERPLPSGRIAPAAARGLWTVLTLVGIVLATLVSWQHFVVAAIVVSILYLYNRRFKRIPVLGNAAVALVVALSLIYGGLVLGSPTGAAVGAVFAFTTTLAREVIKDIEDMPGDRADGARSIPISFGLPTARATAAGAVLLTVVLTPIPFLAMDYGSLFLFLVLIADIVLLRSVWLLPSMPEEAAASSTWLKAGMVAGMAALFAA